MQVRNFTPFSTVCFESTEREGRPIGVMVARGTFRIVPGQVLKGVREQEPIRLRHVYNGAPGRSSLRFHADIVPFKPRTDVHVHAVARVPGGAQARQWPVRVQVGDLTHDVVVRGPSRWQWFVIGGWRRTEVVPIRRLPMTYEHAFGGDYGSERDPNNAVGTGWLSASTPRDVDVAAPQIVGPNEPAHKPGMQYVPQGLGPLPPSSDFRLRHAGTFDAAWQHSRHPRLPADFSYSFYNSAHPGLIHPHCLRGNESVRLVHLTPIREVLDFMLPDFGLSVLWRAKMGLMVSQDMRLDTLEIDVASDDPAEHRVYLVWRASYRLDQPMRAVELRMLEETNRHKNPHRLLKKYKAA